MAQIIVMLLNCLPDVDRLLAELDVGVLGQVDLVRAQVVVPLDDDHVAVLDHRHCFANLLS